MALTGAGEVGVNVPRDSSAPQPWARTHLVPDLGAKYHFPLNRTSILRKTAGSRPAQGERKAFCVGK